MTRKPTGPRIKNADRPTHAVVSLANDLSELIDAATPLANRARGLDLRATARQVEKIAVQLDVMRTVLVAEGEPQLDVARAYADVCADRLAVHGGYIGRVALARA
ncbi:hypothetical protein [Microbacterium sp. RG1]|uniref:hypothetical protein n=1 Tax=Microbacterium sp. RG1 TaxID=2489212 RepID=UPI0010CA217F|nr:hypothetical protein [Microbacterium sp. RG1]QCQ16996.1 hypothetical protein EHF32_09840 [Microbacterium sp. RG1]